MACLNKFSNEQQGHCTSIPRISFSSDFADAQQVIKHESSYREPPVSSDFEFSSSRYSMISADELIVKGKLLPLKEHCNKMTLRDELLVDDDDEYEDVLPRLPKGYGRWKERFGLKRAHFVPVKKYNPFSGHRWITFQSNLGFRHVHRACKFCKSSN